MMRSLIQGPLKWEEESLLLRDVITPFGCNWESISFVIPKSVSLVIKATPLPLTTEGADRLSWSSHSGSFELKEAYRLAIGSETCITLGNIWSNWVWKVDTLPKI